VALIRRLPSVIVKLAVISVVLTAVLGACFLYESPIAFQKASALTVAPDPVIDWQSDSPVLQAARVIGSIPYSSTEPIFDVLPSAVYEQTMLYGRGNCANKCRGLSVFLLRAGVPFHRVEILPTAGFLHGQGHVLVRTKYEFEGKVLVGLIDPLEGAHLALGGGNVDLAELRRATPFSLELKPLTARVDRQSEYYGTLLNDVVIATTNPGETAAYFRFIEAIYVPLGHPRFERIFYNALAVLCGRFPSSRVSQADYDRLFAGREWIVWSAGVLRWSARIVLLLLPLIVVERSVRLVRRILRGKPDEPSGAQPSNTRA
jgi:hypothetical protein